MTLTKAALNVALQNPVMQDGTFSAEFTRFLNELLTDRRLSTGPAQPRTIAGGVIQLIKGYSYYSVDTQSAAASDDLDTISNGNEGDLIFLKAANASRTVVVKDGTGNIKTNGGVDLSLDNTDDLVLLHFDGSFWKADLWNISA
jgi:hypothetical protein